MLVNGDATYERLKKVTPLGSQTLSKMPSRYIQGIYPKVLEAGNGALVKDLDGNQYIDLIAGLGAVSVGYADSQVSLAVMHQLAKGVSFSLPHRLEAEVAERLCELVPNTDMWKFGKNGTDATVMAVRAARALTGRTQILSIGYNGCADVFEAAGTRRAGIPGVLTPLIDKAIYNDIESFNVLRSELYACVIMEPMVYEYPNPGFLEAVRDICTETGTVLIFDEVVTGGRFESFTAQSHFKVVPDLTCLGKAIANGFPLCAVGGRRRFMQVFERDDFFASGTFGGETVSLSACLATVDRLQKDLPQTILNGTHIMQAFNNYFKGRAACTGYPTRFIFNFPSKEHKGLFMQEMCLNGVLIGHANMPPASLTDQDVTDVITALYQTFKVMYDNWLNPAAALKGKLPEDVFKVR